MKNLHNYQNFIKEQYYQDMTQYNYGGIYDIIKKDAKLSKLVDVYGKYVNIGWLSKDYDFERGDVPNGFIQNLNIKKKRESIHRGYHNCDFCGNSHSCSIYKIDGDEKSYIFPDMLQHYIEQHKYKPPQEFIDVVMK